MEWILGIDTSSTELGVGLVHQGRPVAGYSRYVAGSHAEHIQHTVDFFLKENSVAPSAIGGIGIAVGPGSFTGLRIGLAFVKGFTFMRDVRVVAVSSLESMALAWRPSCARPLVATFDARRAEVFWARFRWVDGRITRETPDALVSASAFAEALTDEDIVITDTLGYSRSTVYDVIAGRPDRYAIETNPLLRGLACARRAAWASTDEWVTAYDLVPRYLSEAYVKPAAAKSAETTQ